MKKSCLWALLLSVQLVLFLIIVLLSVPLFVLFFLKKQEFKSRLFQKLPVLSDSIWIHAASMGELNGVYSFFDKIRKSYPRSPIIITTTSLTGLNKVKKTFPKHVHSLLFPIDFLPITYYYIRKLRPARIIIMETELWPCFSLLLRIKKIPAVLINGRLSKKSLKNYLRTSWLWKNVLVSFTHIIAKSEEDSGRFSKLGFPKEKISVIDQIKNIGILSQYQTKHLFFPELAQWKNENSLLIFASVREKEENDVICSIKNINRLNNIKIIFAPRHMNRLEALKSRLQDEELDFFLRSQHIDHEDKKIMILDTMGELLSCFQYANISFVGGSLFDYGGHNVLEPVLFQCPVLYGPYTSSCQMEADLVARFNSGKMVEDGDSLKHEITHLLRSPKDLNILTQNCSHLVEYLESNKKSLDEIISTILD